MITIKIGRKTYEVKPGDYFMDNGACIQFCAGDKRTLKFERYTDYTSLVMPKKEWSRLCREYAMSEREHTGNFNHKITIYRITSDKS